MKKSTRILCAVLAVILAAAIGGGAWYVRPQSLARLYPGLELSNCGEIRVSASSEDGSTRTYQFSLAPGDPGFQRLLDFFREGSFRRSLLPPPNGQKHSPAAGDFKWNLVLFIYGDTLVFDEFYGTLTVTHGTDTQRLLPAGDAGWSAQVMAAIRETEP